jgi:uncharacterized protein YpmS
VIELKDVTTMNIGKVVSRRRLYANLLFLVLLSFLLIGLAVTSINLLENSSKINEVRENTDIFSAIVLRDELARLVCAVLPLVLAVKGIQDCITD